MEIQAPTRYEYVFAVILWLMSAGYLLFAGIQFNDTYTRIYQSVLFVTGTLLTLAIVRTRIPSIPAGLIGLGNPAKEALGVPWILVGGIIGVILIFFLRGQATFEWAQLPPVGAAITSNSLAQISIGASLFEETLSGMILLPTFYIIFTMLGILGALVVFSLMLAFVVGFEYYFILILAIGLAIFLARTGIASKLSPIYSLIAAILMNAAFFGILHLKMSGGSIAYAQSAAFFRIIMDVFTIYFGGGAAIIIHAFNNALTFGGGDVSVALTVVGILAISLYGYTQIARKIA